MKLVSKGASNTLILTCAEKQTLTSPYFLFRFINKITRQENSCIAADTSSYTYRYNQFVITESSTENRTNGTLELSPTGEWDLEVYEQSSSSNLDYRNATTLLEKVLVVVVGSEVANQYYNIDNTLDVYGTGA